MALSGVTTTADMFCHAPGPEPSVPGVVEALDRIGLRGDVSYGAQDDSNPRPLERVLAEHEALAAAAAASRRSRFRVGLATVPAASDELIAATVKLLGETPRLHVHLHEVREEVTHSRVQPRRWARSSTRPGPGCWTPRSSPRTASGSTTPTSRCCGGTTSRWRTTRCRT